MGSTTSRNPLTISSNSSTNSSNSSTNSSNSFTNSSNSSNSNSQFKVGDVIYRYLESFAGAAGFKHYGIYVGHNCVIHFTCDENKNENENGVVEKIDYNTFARDMDVYVDSGWSIYPISVLAHLIWKRSGSEIAQCAQDIYNNVDGKKSEWKKYSSVWNNCEHFTSFCATGKKLSDQSII